MPDIENLKFLSRLLNVSVDYLLCEEVSTESAVIRESYHLAAYGRGCKKVRKDRYMCQRFPEARICTLLGRPKLEETDRAMDSVHGFLTSDPFGMPEFLKSARDTQREYYLVESESESFFVTVSDTFVEIRPFSVPLETRSFQLGNWIFIRCDYLAQE